MGKKRSMLVHWSTMRGGIVEGETLVMGSKNVATVIKVKDKWHAHAGNQQLAIPHFACTGDAALITLNAAKALAFNHVRKSLAQQGPTQ